LPYRSRFGADFGNYRLNGVTPLRAIPHNFVADLLKATVYTRFTTPDKLLQLLRIYANEWTATRNAANDRSVVTSSLPIIDVRYNGNDFADKGRASAFAEEILLLLSEKKAELTITLLVALAEFAPMSERNFKVASWGIHDR
jgi:hypothetical protein